MVALASINLNKGFYTQDRKNNLLCWLRDNHVDAIFAQEPWRNDKGPQTYNFADFVPIGKGGNDRVFSWVNVQSSFSKREMVMVEERCQRIELGSFVIYNVYLNSNTGLDGQENRALQLRQLQKKVVEENHERILILGDFNLAPERSDGLKNDEASDFNSEVDRGPLRFLLKTCSLVDLGRNVQSPW